MADNFGTRQNRVLTVSDRNLDNVVFQKSTPPLSSEWNLINQISNQKTQDLSKVLLPSGWLNVGGIYQDKDESLFVTGDINCSFSYAANSFKLCGTGNHVAIVNGWPISVKGTNSTDENNVIFLPDPTGIDYDYHFVFLEVWRQLVAYNEPIYPYGNVLKTPVSPNEIRWDAISIETTKRVQIQYRIRTAVVDTMLIHLNDVNHTGDVFSEVPIYPIGGSLFGEVNGYPYASFGASDGGLYVAGSGDSTSQTMLNTVDGFVYAIPMFLVNRRNPAEDFTATSVSGNRSTKASFQNGYAIDRPDNKVSDVVYKNDVVDFRHKIVTSNLDAEQILDESVSKLLAGELTTAVKYGFGNNADVTAASSGGSELLKVDQLNPTTGMPSIGVGSSQVGYSFKRRVFCNAQMLSDHNVIEIQPPIGGWVENYTFNAATAVNFPDGIVYSVDGFYTTGTNPIITGLGQVGSTTTYRITSSGANNLVANPTARLLMEFTFLYNASSSGFKDVPKEFLEIRKGNFQQIATRDSGSVGISVRYNNSNALVHDSLDVLAYKGGNYTEGSYFGHEMVVYSNAQLSTFNIALSDGKYNQHYLLGIKAVETQDTPTSPWVSVSFNQHRNISLSPSYKINSYTVDVYTTGPSTRKARVVFYTGSGYIGDVGGPYSLTDSFKFFELSKQGRGVIDTYEMIDAFAVEDVTSPGTYVIDTASGNVGDKPIISVAATFQSGVRIFFGFRSDISGVSVSLSVSPSLPVLDSTGYSSSCTPTMIKVSATPGLNKIRVPVLVHSYVVSTEVPYSFYYKTIPYQGLLTTGTNFYGKIEKEGPGIITTLGSGAVINYQYTEGRASVITSSATVTGVADGLGNLPKWTQYVQPGDYFIKHNNSGLAEHIFARYYKIKAINDDVTLQLSEPFLGTGSTTSESFLPSAVNISNSSITITQSKVVNDIVRFNNSGGALPAGLSAGVDFYVIQAGTTIKVSLVQGGSIVVLSDQGSGTHSIATSSTEYQIIRLDVPVDGLANIIDRLPAYKVVASSGKDVVDYGCASDPIITVAKESINFSSTVVNTTPQVKINDPLNAWVNDFVVGSEFVSKRGRNNFYLSSGKNASFKVSLAGQGPRPYLVYQSVFSNSNRKIAQVYLFNRSAKDMLGGESGLTGRLYLMVVVSEVTNTSDNKLNGMLKTDTVDIFELSGRPIIKV